MKNEKKTKSPKKPMGLRQKLFKTSVSRPGLKQLEEEIKLFNNLINQSNDAIAVVEPETGRFLYVNDKVCNNLGYSRGELLNMKVVDIEAILPDSFSWNKHVEEVKCCGYVILEGKHKRKDGTTFPVCVNVKYLTQNKKDYMVAIILDINERAYADLGFSRNEFLNMRVADVDTAMQGNFSWKRFVDEIRKRGSMSTEAAGRHKDGSILPVEVNARFIILDNKEYIIAVIRDITEWKKMENELRTREQQQAAISKLGQFALANSDFEIVMNEAVKIVAETLKVEYCKVLELLPDGDALLLKAGVGWKKGLIGSATVQARANSQAGYTLLSNEPVIVEDLNAETRFKGPKLLFNHGVISGVSVIIQGRERPYGILGAHSVKRLNFTKDDVSFLQAMANVIADIVERERVEKKLQESEKKYRKLINLSKDAIFIVRNDKSISYAIPACFDIFGYTPEEFITNPELVIKITHPDCHSQLTEFWDNYARTKKFPENTSEWICIGKDNRIIYTENTFTNTYNDAREVIGFQTVARDITERKKAEEALLRMQKLESLGILAGGIAHDFNNVLTAILGNISLAKMRTGPDDKISKTLTDAEKGCFRAKELTQQLITFSKGGSPVKRTASLIELIKDSTTFTLSGSKTKPEFYIPENLWPVEADEGQISQVINNLVLNADQAMPEGGIIELRGENIILREKEIPSLKKGSYVKIMVKDYGIGIAKGNLQKIFDPYFTTKQKGSGLGLATTYSIIRNHDGYISVESEIGKETAFSIYLPASEKEAAKKEDVKRDYMTGSGRILIMDDEDIVRDVTGDILTMLGYEVDFAKDGKEAIELYKKAKESGKSFDVVIMDLTIPGGMGGKETVKKLLEIDPDAKAIVSSGYSSDPIMSDYKSYGFRGVVVKPYNTVELSRVVADVVKGNE